MPKQAPSLSLFLLLTYFSIAAQVQTQEDPYTRYELLAPETHSFRIIYDVSATTPGALNYFNTHRQGSEHEIEAVYDRMSGEALDWEVVNGIQAQAEGLVRLHYVNDRPDAIDVFIRAKRR